MTEVARADDLRALDQMDPAVREQAVTAYLEAARDKLTLAMNLNGPEAVAAIKAEIATAAEATKQLGLSKEIRDDALEMVRRAEYALGKAIRAGQDCGEVARSVRETGGGSDIRSRIPTSLPRPTDFASHAELVGNEGTGIYGLVDGVSDTQFEVALSDAREEGNLSRANVVRKIKGVKSEALTPVEKLTKIRELAPTGRTSAQIAQEIGCSESYVRERARKIGVKITADEVLRGTHRLKVDSNRIVNETVTALDGLVSGVALIKFDDLDADQAENWTASLTESIRVLNRFAKQIKEMVQ